MNFPADRMELRAPLLSFHVSPIISYNIRRLEIKLEPLALHYNAGEPEYSKYARDPDYDQQETLREYLQNNHSKLTLSDRITIFKTLCLSLSDIHDRGLIYRNLHSGKVLVKAGKCYIPDLGSCGPVDGKNEKDGMIPYIAPEVLRKRSKNTKESDVYGIGMLMWEIFSGSPPFDNIAHDHCLILEICKEDLRPPILPNMPEEYAEMMQECWDVDPSKRPTIGELYEFARDFSANVYDINNNNSFVDHNTFHNTVDNSINNMNKTPWLTRNSFDDNNNNLDVAFGDNQVEVKDNAIYNAAANDESELNYKLKFVDSIPYYDLYVLNKLNALIHSLSSDDEYDDYLDWNDSEKWNEFFGKRRNYGDLLSKNFINHHPNNNTFNNNSSNHDFVPNCNYVNHINQTAGNHYNNSIHQNPEDNNSVRNNNNYFGDGNFVHIGFNYFINKQLLLNIVSQLQNLQSEKITWKDKIMSLFWIYYELLAENYLLKISQQTEQNK